MTREEIKKAMRDTKKEVVLKNLHKLLSLVEGYPEYEDCVGYAIEALEQEPILDRVRAEIEPKCDRINSIASVLPYTAHREIQELLCEIMDLCKAESEVEE